MGYNSTYWNDNSCDYNRPALCKVPVVTSSSSSPTSKS
eukprot:gene14359-30565_t